MAAALRAVREFINVGAHQAGPRVWKRVASLRKHLFVLLVARACPPLPVHLSTAGPGSLA